MKIKKITFIPFITFLFFLNGFFNSLYAIDVSPVFTYQKDKVYLPTTHDRELMHYGLKIRLGPRILGLEAQGLQGQGKETFADNTSSKVESRKLRAGISSIFGDAIAFEARGGADQTTTANYYYNNLGALISEDKPKPKINPYAGATLILRIVPMVRVYSGVTYIFIDKDNWTKLENQTREFTLGFTVNVAI